MMSCRIVLTLVLATLALSGLGGCADMGQARYAKQTGDYQTAFTHYSELADFGVTDAKVELARMYARGEGVPKNEAAAVPLLQDAARAGNPKAYYDLAKFYEKGLGGLPQNGALADEHYAKSAALGYVTAAYYRGKMHERGKAVPMNIPMAMSLYQQAASEGRYARAAGTLGELTEIHGFIPATEEFYVKNAAPAANEPGPSVMALALYYAADEGAVEGYKDRIAGLEQKLNADEVKKARALSRLYL